jgi:hypothetical protein
VFSKHVASDISLALLSTGQSKSAIASFSWLLSSSVHWHWSLLMLYVRPGLLLLSSKKVEGKDDM